MTTTLEDRPRTKKLKVKKTPRPIIADDPSGPSPKMLTKKPKGERLRFDKVLRVDPSKVKITPQAPTKRYWVGAFPDSPFDVKHVGGVAFQKWTGIVESDPSSGQLMLDRAQAGAVVSLTDDHVEKVLEGMAKKVIRTVGKREDATGNYRCDSYDVTNPGYRPMHGDMPMGRFVYMIEVCETMPPDWRSQRPPAMVEGY